MLYYAVSKHKTTYNKAARRRQFNLTSYWTIQCNRMLKYNIVTLDGTHYLFIYKIRFNVILQRTFGYPQVVSWPAVFLRKLGMYVFFFSNRQVMLQICFMILEPRKFWEICWSTAPCDSVIQVPTVNSSIHSIRISTQCTACWRENNAFCLNGTLLLVVREIQQIFISMGESYVQREKWENKRRMEK
jgi:hypothetical protein